MDKKEDIFKYGMKAGKEPDVKTVMLDTFFKKAAAAVIMLLVLVGIFLVGYSIKPCPACQACVLCPEPERLDCNACPTQSYTETKIRYACVNGLVVDALADCDPLKHMNLTSEFQATGNGVIVSIDNIRYEERDDYNKVTGIDYTIVNTNAYAIKPRVLVNIFTREQEAEDRNFVHEVFDEEEFLKGQSWITKRQKTSISYLNGTATVRLVVKDTVPDPDEQLLIVARPVKP